MFKALILFFLLGTGTIVAQDLVINASVIDAQTKRPIPFVNMIFVNHKIGTSADANGSFRFTVKERLKDESVYISCVGYEQRTLKVSELLNSTVSLNQELNTLSEVNLYKMHFENQKRVNSFRGKQIVGLGNFSGGAYPSALARFYERPEKFEKACFLKSVEIQFYKILGKPSQKATFRLRVLSVDTDNKPGKDLLGADLIIDKPEGKQNLKVELIPYKINVPQEGFFVVVEHIFIEENKFSESYTIKVNDSVGYKEYLVDRYAPVFKGVETSPDDKEISAFYRSIGGWKSIELLNTAASAMNGKLPTPAFKILFTD